MTEQERKSNYGNRYMANPIILLTTPAENIIRHQIILCQCHRTLHMNQMAWLQVSIDCQTWPESWIFATPPIRPSLSALHQQLCTKGVIRIFATSVRRRLPGRPIRTMFFIESSPSLTWKCYLPDILCLQQTVAWEKSPRRHYLAEYARRSGIGLSPRLCHGSRLARLLRASGVDLASSRQGLLSVQKAISRGMWLQMESSIPKQPGSTHQCWRKALGWLVKRSRSTLRMRWAYPRGTEHIAKTLAHTVPGIIHLITVVFTARPCRVMSCEATIRVATIHILIESMTKTHIATVYVGRTRMATIRVVKNCRIILPQAMAHMAMFLAIISHTIKTPMDMARMVVATEVMMQTNQLHRCGKNMGEAFSLRWGNYAGLKQFVITNWTLPSQRIKSSRLSLGFAHWPN